MAARRISSGSGFVAHSSTICHITPCARPQQRHHGDFVVVARQGETTGAVGVLRQTTCQFHAIHPRHPDVGEDQIDVQPGDCIEGLKAVGGSACKDEPVRFSEVGRENVEDLRVIVNHKETGGTHALSFVFSGNFATSIHTLPAASAWSVPPAAVNARRML